jgi:Family of unknown function (DUF5681)
MTDKSETKAKPRPPHLWKKGQSGNPAGMPKGTRHKAIMAAEALLDGESDALTRKAVEMALAGDTVAMRLCLERIVPPRKDRPVAFPLPKIENPAGATNLMSAMLEAVAKGEVTPCEAGEISKLIEGYVKMHEMTEFEARLKALEERTGIDNNR